MEHLSPYLGLNAVVLAIAWWKWPLLVIGVLAVLLWLMLKSYRRSVRKNLVRYLRECHPEIEIVSEHGDHMVIRVGKVNNGRMNLHNLFSQIAAAKGRTPEDDRAIFKKFVTGLMENLEQLYRPMSLESDGDFLLPRLMNETDLAGLQHDAKVIHQPLAGTSLFVVYVRDSENAVSYLPETALAELQLDVSALHERTLANLRKKTGPDFARQVLAGNTLSLLKLGDTFDAARLLLVPEQLRDGEALAVVIPDRDTLGMTPIPSDGDWTGLMKLARAAGGPRLLNRPLKVTRNGFELMGKQ